MSEDSWDLEADPETVVGALTPPPDAALTDPFEQDLAEVHEKLKAFISTELLNGGEVGRDKHGVYNFLYGDTHICIEAYEG